MSRCLTTAYALFNRLPQRTRRWLVRRVAPTYTVGAVVLLRASDTPGAGRMLLVRQPSRLGWSLPAGLLARGEAPIDGAVRELAEETGVRLRPTELRAAVPNAMVHHHGRWVDIVFEASVPAETTELRVDGSEIVAAQWHDLDDLPRLTTATARLLGHYGIGPGERSAGRA